MNTPNLLRWLADQIEAGDVHAKLTTTEHHESQRTTTVKLGPTAPSGAVVILEARWLGVMPDAAALEAAGKARR